MKAHRKQNNSEHAATSPAPQAAEADVDHGNAAALEQIEFPHLAAIESATGASLAGEAVLDPAGCKKRGTPAYTEGTVTHFSSATPSLAIAAHEFTHLLHHTGQSADHGMGAEGHAQAVAKSVLRGEDASHLLSDEGNAVIGDTHNYTSIATYEQDKDAQGWVNPEGEDLMVSDDGNLAVTDSGFGNSQVAWAHAGDISAANAILEGQGSTVRLKAGAADLSGQAPDGKGGDKSLQRVEVEMANGDKDVTLTDDCGTAAHEVTGAHSNMVFAAQIGDGQGGTTHTDPHRYVGGSVAPQQTAPVAYFDDVMRREWPQMSRDEHYAKWAALSDTERDAFEQKYQIGKYAVPDVGQGFTIASLYETPGWEKQKLPNGDDQKTWNFHYATCILSSGHDYTTLENYADHGPENWYFWMSGPASKDQSFWHQHEAQQGTFSTAFVVDPAHTMDIDVTNLRGSGVYYNVEASTANGPSTGKAATEYVGGSSSHTFKVAIGDVIPKDKYFKWNGQWHLDPQRGSEDIRLKVIEDGWFSDNVALDFTWSPPFDKAATGKSDAVSATARMNV